MRNQLNCKAKLQWSGQLSLLIHWMALHRQEVYLLRLLRQEVDPLRVDQQAQLAGPLQFSFACLLGCAWLVVHVRLQVVG